jgi:hypothetical protein
MGQNGPRNIPKLLLVVKYSQCPQNFPTLSLPRPSKIYQNVFLGVWNYTTWQPYCRGGHTCFGIQWRSHGPRAKNVDLGEKKILGNGLKNFNCSGKTWLSSPYVTIGCSIRCILCIFKVILSHFNLRRTTSLAAPCKDFAEVVFITRVTRLGEFSPLGSLLLGQFWRNLHRYISM